MSKLKSEIPFETTFGTYIVHELIGEGGAGRVYGGIGIDGAPIALKVLAEDRATSDKKRRFKNEVAFLARNKHANIVTVIDNGVALSGEIRGPFYVMRRYDGSLRDLMRTGIAPDNVLSLFSQILEGVEAAHLQGVIHRDLKPENILHDRESGSLAIADFGTARFTEDLVATVETAPGQRLANFQYAAPEQRTPGQSITSGADIYALGLILNEMFTGDVPQGTEFRLIGQVAEEMRFLDEVVAKMRRQAPADRLASVAEVKGVIQRNMAETVSLQRLSRIDGTVIKAAEIDEPLALTPPRLADVDWDGSTLTLTLNRSVSPEWINALQRMRGFSYSSGKPPVAFTFVGNKASIRAAEHEVQNIVDHFKTWLPQASLTLKGILEEDARQQEAGKESDCIAKPNARSNDFVCSAISKSDFRCPVESSYANIQLFGDLLPPKSS